MNNINTRTRTIIIVLGIVSMASMATMPAFATKSPYESGFKHGASDCRISDSDDWYINGVNDKGESTGPDHHTNEFMDGYENGFNSCNKAETIIKNVDTNIRENTQNQAAETNQGASCKILIGNCNVGQSSENAFANKNDN